VNFFFRTSTGEFWAGTQNGLLQIGMDGSWVGFESAEPTHRQILSACEDLEGSLWVGTGHGLNRYRQGVLESYIDLEPRAIDVVSALHADADGAVWIGTDRGLWRHRAGQFFAFEAKHGGPPVVGQILEDDRGHLWFAQGEVLSRFSKAQLNAVADGRAERVESRSFSRGAAMRTSLVGGCVRAVKTRDGLLAFAADHGVLLVDPIDPPRMDTPPPVMIEQLVLNGEPLPLPAFGPGSGPAGPVVLPPGYNRIEIHYAGLAFVAPHGVRFRHRLRGLSEAWEDTGASRMAQFRALPPGRYDFEVAAAQGSGAWSQPPVGLSLRVLAPWWQGTWLKAAVGASLLLSAGGWYALRMRRLEHMNTARRDFSMRLLEREESERRRLSRELHDGLGQDLLVIKNQATLLGQQLPAEREDLQRTAREIAEASQAAIEGARTIAYNLRPADLDRAGLTRSLAAMLDRAGASASLTLDHALENLDGSLAPEAEVALYRVTQELTKNLLKHADARRAFVDLRRAPDAVELAVADDGRGFDPAVVRSRVGPGKGLGLDSIHERVAMLDGEVRMESAPGQGTRFLIRIPLRPAPGETERIT
jgi:signal transduction histidine kinase